MGVPFDHTYSLVLQRFTPAAEKRRAVATKGRMESTRKTQFTVAEGSQHSF